MASLTHSLTPAGSLPLSFFPYGERMPLSPPSLLLVVVVLGFSIRAASLSLSPLPVSTTPSFCLIAAESHLPNTFCTTGGGDDGAVGIPASYEVRVHIVLHRATDGRTVYTAKNGTASAAGPGEALSLSLSPPNTPVTVWAIFSDNDGNDDNGHLLLYSQSVCSLCVCIHAALW